VLNEARSRDGYGLVIRSGLFGMVPSVGKAACRVRQEWVGG